MNISNPNHNRKALVIFSGGQDSTTCLIQAIAEYGVENVRNRHPSIWPAPCH